MDAHNNCIEDFTNPATNPFVQWELSSQKDKAFLPCFIGCLPNARYSQSLRSKPDGLGPEEVELKSILRLYKKKIKQLDRFFFQHAQTFPFFINVHKR